MTEWERNRLQVLMARMADGDTAAPFALYDEFGHVVANVMRRHVRALGTATIGRDDLDGLTMDACLELAACARAWRPDGGALPWSWAGARLRALASRFVGTYADELDEAEAPEVSMAPAAAGEEPDAFGLLQHLAADRPMAALLCEALEEVASDRDRRILVEIRLQAHLGDPSPSRTLAAEHGLSPDAVRQAASRLRRRLRELAASDERFAPLADLPLVA